MPGTSSGWRIYTLIKGVDRSLFEVFRAAGGNPHTQTHQADFPLMEVAGARYENNPWSGIVQGIPHHLSAKFEAFVSSYRFKKGSPEIHDPANDVVWRVDWQPTRIADPFSSARVGVLVKIAMPVNLTTGRCAAHGQGPGPDTVTSCVRGGKDRQRC